MGMAASQARLLTITARIHDVEYQSQAIQNAKVQLSTQSDQVYQEYLEALDATTLTINAIDTASGATSTVAATFNNLCSINKLTPASGNANLALVTNKGQLIVSDNILEGYLDFKDNGLDDPYQFALFMMDEAAGVLQAVGNWDDGTIVEGLQELTESVYQSNASNNTTIKNLHEQLESMVGEGYNIYDPSQITDEKDLDKYQETLKAYEKAMYENYTATIYAEASDGDKTTEDFDMDEFNYYVNIYKQIQACYGNVTSIADFNGSAGDAANDSEWLQNMVKSGVITIKNCSIDDYTGVLSMDSVNPSSDSNLNYTETASIDKRALAKAEAKYEHDLKEIDQKDKQYDMTLSKLESERTALTTEYDSVKKVIQDNIERTFGIFS